MTWTPQKISYSMWTKQLQFPSPRTSVNWDHLPWGRFLEHAARSWCLALAGHQILCLVVKTLQSQQFKKSWKHFWPQQFQKKTSWNPRDIKEESKLPPSVQTPTHFCPLLSAHLSAASGSDPASCMASEPAGVLLSPWVAAPSPHFCSCHLKQMHTSVTWICWASWCCNGESGTSFEVWPDVPVQGRVLEQLPSYLKGSRKSHIKSFKCCLNSGVTLCCRVFLSFSKLKKWDAPN